MAIMMSAITIHKVFTVIECYLLLLPFLILKVSFVFEVVTNSIIFEVNSIASQRFFAFWVINNCIIFVLLLKPITLQAKELIEPSLYCFLSDYSFVTTKLQFCIFFTRFLHKLVLHLLHGIGNGISPKFSSSFSKYNSPIRIIRIL